MSKLKETQPNPNPNQRTAKFKHLAAGVAVLALASGVALAARKDSSDSVPKDSAPAATADAPTQETGMPPVPTSPEVSEALKDQLAAQAQSMGESYVRQAIELAKQANNDDVFSEMYINEDGDVDFKVHVRNDSADGTVTETSFSFVTGIKGDKQDPSLEDFDPSTFKELHISSNSTMTAAEAAQSRQNLLELSIFAPGVGEGYVVQVGGGVGTEIYDTGQPSGALDQKVLPLSGDKLPNIQYNADLYIRNAALPTGIEMTS